MRNDQPENEVAELLMVVPEVEGVGANINLKLETSDYAAIYVASYVQNCDERLKEALADDSRYRIAIQELKEELQEKMRRCEPPKDVSDALEEILTLSRTIFLPLREDEREVEIKNDKVEWGIWLRLGDGMRVKHIVRVDLSEEVKDCQARIRVAEKAQEDALRRAKDARRDREKSADVERQARAAIAMSVAQNSAQGRALLQSFESNMARSGLKALTAD